MDGCPPPPPHYHQVIIFLTDLIPYVPPENQTLLASSHLSFLVILFAFSSASEPLAAANHFYVHDTCLAVIAHRLARPRVTASV